MKKHRFAYISGFSALSLACIAGYFSIVGLSKFFSGASTTIMILAASLELAKLVIASLLYRYWTDFNVAMRSYLTMVVLGLVFITSVGVYGYLSSAYSSTAGKLEHSEGQIILVEQKKVVLENQIKRLQEAIDNKNKRINSLVQLRSSQESRVDSLYKKGMVSSARKTEQGIKEANQDINKINVEVDDLNTKMQPIYKEIEDLDLQILEAKNSDVSAEVGPLKYIADLTGKSMGSVANFLMLLLVFVLDPVAVLLVIATNIIMLKYSGNNQVISGNPKKEEDIVVEEVKENDLVIPSSQEPIQEEVKIPEDEPEKKIIEYIEAQDGTFRKKDEVTEENASEVKKSKYFEFLKALFNDGELGKGDSMPTYEQIVNTLQNNGVNFTNKEFNNFLSLCALVRITHMENQDRKILRDFSEAQEIIKML